MNIVIDLLKQILEIVKENKNATEKLARNWDLDREDFAEFKSRIGHLEEEFKALRESVIKLPKKTQERVEDALEPATEQINGLQNAIVEKKVMLLDMSKLKDKRWPALFRIFRRENNKK